MLTVANAPHELATFCQRRQIQAPRFVRAREGTLWRVEGSLELDAHTVASGAHVAASLEEAERLAALALALALAEFDDDPEPGEWVDAQAGELRGKDPKTRLLNALVHRGLRAPVFEVVAIMTHAGNAFEGGAFLELGEGVTVHTPVRCARERDVVEQASARALLMDEEVRAVLACVPDEIPLNYAEALLRELQEAGELEACGVVYHRRPTVERPLFKVAGWWRGRDGKRHHTKPIEALSKKAAEALAARAVLEKLRPVLAAARSKVWRGVSLARRGA